MTSPQGFSMVPRWIMEDPTISANAVRAFGILSGRVRRGGIRLRQQEIADILGVSWRTAHRSLVELRDLGVLSWTKPDGDLDGVDYSLLIDRRGLDDAPDTADTPDTPVMGTPDTAVTSPLTPVSALPYRGLKTSSLRSESAARRATRIDAERFEIDPAMRAWASEKVPHVDVDAETERFVDYWTSESGARARKVDWTGTWRNWMRRAGEGRNGSRPPSPVESAWARAQPLVDEPACHLCPETRIHRHTRDGSVVLR